MRAPGGVIHRNGLESDADPTRAVDVVVVGGGVIGLAIAWRVAIQGRSAAVVDPSVGRGASWVAAGMLAPATEVHYGEEDLMRLNVASSRIYTTFVAELETASDMSVGYKACGTLIVARDSDENAELEELYRFQMSVGLEVERLTGRECRRLEPGLAPSIRGGIMVVGDHQVDNRALVTALERACDRSGVVLVAETVSHLMTDDSRATGVRLQSGEHVMGSSVVLAAGCWSRSVKGLPPEAIPPVRPVKGQVVHLLGPKAPSLASRAIRGLHTYIVPRGDGRIVVGATVEERGFDTAVTAGGVFHLLRDAYEILPGVVELEVTETIAGLRPGSPDNAPMLGPSVVPGLVIATGHYRNGILLTPITAQSICEYLSTGAVPDLIAPFSPQRFARSEATV